MFQSGVNTLSKMVNHFLSKSTNILYGEDACGPNTNQIMWGRLWTSNVSISNDNMKCLIGKPIFAVMLPLKLFRAAVANADLGSLNRSLSIHSLKMFIPHACEMWTKSYGFNYMKLGAFWPKKKKKKSVFITIFEKEIFNICGARFLWAR